jgi:hypothetical protein
LLVVVRACCCSCWQHLRLWCLLLLLLLLHSLVRRKVLETQMSWPPPQQHCQSRALGSLQLLLLLQGQG